jgi:hypothetical protein
MACNGVRMFDKDAAHGAVAVAQTHIAMIPRAERHPISAPSRMYFPASRVTRCSWGTAIHLQK